MIDIPFGAAEAWAIAPFSVIERSGFLITAHDVAIAPITPAPVARSVFRATYAKKPTPP